MSFYSYKNTNAIMPGRVQGESMQGITERVCIEVKKVYDSCLQQEQLENVRITLRNITPANVTFTPPLTFRSCRSTISEGVIRNLVITRLPERPNFARVQADVDIPVQVTFTDVTGRQGTGTAVITVHKDVILFVPDESIIPFTAAAIVSAICVTGTFINDFTFNVTVCITVILKIVAEVNLLIPAFGFCNIPPCEQFAEEVCEEFFGLPIFPPQID